MPLVNFKVGQPVFIIEVYNIFEANITKFLNQKEVEVTTDGMRQPGYKTIKTYGVDWFLTREKADKVLAKKFEMLEMRLLERRKEQKEQERRRETQEDTIDKLPDSKIKSYITNILREDPFKGDELENEIDDKKLMEITCFTCEFGDRLDYNDQKETGKQMFCRKYWTPIMKNEHKNCLYFQPLTLVPITIYSGGTFSGK